MAIGVGVGRGVASGIVVVVVAWGTGVELFRKGKLKEGENWFFRK